jgi:predicted outer membrane protein
MLKRDLSALVLGTLMLAAPAFAEQPPTGTTKAHPQGTPQQGSVPGAKKATPSATPQDTAPDEAGLRPTDPHGTMGKGMMGKGMMGLDSDMTDAELASMIHQINQHEIEMAALAKEKATSAQVKALAKQIGSDHEKADKALTMLAGKKGWDLTTPTALGTTGKPDDTHATNAANAPSHGDMHENHAEKMTEHLKTMTGADFDRHFLIMMQKGHNDTIMMLTAQAFGQSIDKELRAEIKKSMPALEKHRSRSIAVLEKEGSKALQPAG